MKRRSVERGGKMNSKDFYFEIGNVQERPKSLDQDQLYQALQRSVKAHPWRSPLIYGLYARQIGSADVAAFFARKTLEAIEAVCEQGINKGGKTLKKPGMELLDRLLAPILRVLKHITARRMPEEELQFRRKRLDQLLVAMTFLILAFDSTQLRAVIESVDQDIAKELRRIKARFIDTVPLRDYLAILERQFQKSEEVIQPLSMLFDELIRSANLEETSSFEQRVANLRKCVETLVEEAGRRIEKPDRIFSYADSLDIISRYAESLFDIGENGKGRFFSKYKWAYPRGRSFDNLNRFWIACMIGLFSFDQALDRSVALAHEQAEAKATSIQDGSEKSLSTEIDKTPQKTDMIEGDEPCKPHSPIDSFLAKPSPVSLFG